MPSERQLSDVLTEFARTMVTEFPIQGILDHLVKRIVEIMPITAAGVTLISPAASPRYVAASDDSALRYEELQTELGQGPCLTAYETGEPVAVPDIRDEKRFGRFVPRAMDAGLGAVFTFPLHQGDRRLGALDLYRDTPGPLDDDDMAAAQTLADVTAAYLVNAQTRADLQEASDRSHALSMHDALTGLPNRILLLERLERAALRGLRSKQIVAMLFVDLDDFKAVNDKFGHHVGDALLMGVAQRITGLLRPADTLARMSGDEFVVLCEGVGDVTHTEAIARRVVNALAVPFLLSGETVQVTASVGIAVAPAGSEVSVQLLVDADIAMYQVKRRGGGAYQVLDLSQRRLTARRSSLEHDLGRAAQRGELLTEYQPVVRTVDGQVIGVEALLRWDHPSQGRIPMMTLIPLAEESGHVVALGRWVLERACSDRFRWSSRHGDDRFGMAVNVSAHQLMAPDFVASVTAVLAGTETPPALITLEITETVFVEDIDRALVVLTELKSVGVKLALDDFGTGYSSLSRISGFPFDTIKVDRGFIAQMAHTPASHAVVAMMIELAHVLGMAVVTEGVETADQHRALATLGSDYCQGYYFAGPMSFNSLETLASEAADLRLRLPIARAGAPTGSPDYASDGGTPGGSAGRGAKTASGRFVRAARAVGLATRRVGASRPSAE